MDNLALRLWRPSFYRRHRSAPFRDHPESTAEPSPRQPSTDEISTSPTTSTRKSNLAFNELVDLSELDRENGGRTHFPADYSVGYADEIDSSSLDGGSGGKEHATSLTKEPGRFGSDGVLATPRREGGPPPGVHVAGMQGGVACNNWPRASNL